MIGVLSANDIYNDDVCFRIFYISVYGKLSFGQIRSFFFLAHPLARDLPFVHVSSLCCAFHALPPLD